MSPRFLYVSLAVWMAAHLFANAFLLVAERRGVEVAGVAHVQH